MSGAKMGLSLGGWCAALLLATGCAELHPPKAPRVEFHNPARREGMPVVSVLVPPDPKLIPVVNQLRHELEEEFDVQVTPVDADAHSPESMGRVLESQQPRVVVLINNSTARIYRKWARTVPKPPIAVIVMASLVHQLQRTIPNSVAIAYEVPAVRCFVGLRALGSTINRVGVVYREVLADVVREQEELARVERITFVKQELSQGFDVRDLKAALVRVEREGVDVVWLPNDNDLITRPLVLGVWLPYLERLSLPVVVGVPSLVQSEPAFGVYAAVPDPEALAIQAADLILELSDAHWAFDGDRVQLPLSARTYVSAPLGKRFGLSMARLQNVDVVVGEK